MAQTYFGQLERVEQWIEDQPNVDILRVNYADAHNNPRETATRVIEFLDRNLDVDAMINAVDKQLYRNQSS